MQQGGHLITYRLLGIIDKKMQLRHIAEMAHMVIILQEQPLYHRLQQQVGFHALLYQLGYGLKAFVGLVAILYQHAQQLPFLQIVLGRYLHLLLRWQAQRFRRWQHLIAAGMLIIMLYPVADVFVDEVNKPLFIHVQFAGRLTCIVRLQRKIFRFVDTGDTLCYFIGQFGALYRVGTGIFKPHLQAKADHVLLMLLYIFMKPCGS